VQVVALVGPSGTGKSHRASVVAEEIAADAIIDDGLLIADGKILAGVSAKRAKNKVQAIRRAIFEDEEHRASVRHALSSVAPKRILILGTSEAMVRRIAERLGVPPPGRIIRIEEIASPAQIRYAQSERQQRGRHVIPAPTVEVRKTFSGYLVDPLRFVVRSKNRSRMVEKSVVRPTWTLLGRFTIDDHAVSAIASYAALEVDGVAGVRKVSMESWSEGVNLYIDVSVYYGNPLPPLLAAVRKRAKEVVEAMTALNVLRIEVTAKRLVVRGAEPQDAGGPEVTKL
jgi:uncharacterized alkaline shock family protein YloU